MNKKTEVRVGIFLIVTAVVVIAFINGKLTDNEMSIYFRWVSHFL